MFRSPELIAQTFHGTRSRETEERERLRHEDAELRDRLRAPDIVKAIVDGAEPSGLSFRTLIYNVPRGWDEQRKRFGFLAR